MAILPLIAYFAAKKFATPELLGGIVPEAVIGWVPFLAAILVYAISSQMQSAKASKATSAIVGQEAPDMQLELRKEGKSTKQSLQSLVKDSQLPTVVDFYQNF
uniref:Uncharacterized protein n=1 Tax=Alexandrium catenella TaxID=2925 RepID=A0A7S1RPW5_ALECA